jgi:hypothetical protein
MHSYRGLKVPALSPCTTTGMYKEQNGKAKTSLIAEQIPSPMLMLLCLHVWNAGPQ